MDIILNNPAYLWLGAGALLVVFEALTLPGLGIFLGGLGAICTGLLVEACVIDASAITLQFTSFFGLTTLWAVVLWKPLQKIRAASKNAAGYQNMVGDSAIVGASGLKRGVTGQVTWSGTVMNAEIDASSAMDSLPAGAQVVIKSVAGNTLKVTPK